MLLELLILELYASFLLEVKAKVYFMHNICSILKLSYNLLE